MLINVQTRKAVSQTNEKYAAVDVDVTAGTKVLYGGALAGEDCEFTINGVSESATGYTETVTNDADGNFDFSDIEIAARGVYIYQISEVAGNEMLIAYDTNIYYLIICAMENDDGNLIAPAFILNEEHMAELEANAVGVEKTEELYALLSYITEDELVFNNTLDQVLSINAQKRLIGRSLKANDFSFTLEDVDSGYTEVAFNDENGLVAFGDIEITEGGIYTYTIKENNTGKSGITYDDTVYYLVVNCVIEEGEGYIEKAIVTEKFYNEFLSVNHNEVTPENYADLAEFSLEIAGFENTASAPETGDDKTHIAEAVLAALSFCAIIVFRKKQANKENA